MCHQMSWFVLPSIKTMTVDPLLLDDTKDKFFWSDFYQMASYFASNPAPTYSLKNKSNFSSIISSVKFQISLLFMGWFDWKVADFTICTTSGTYCIFVAKYRYLAVIRQCTSLSKWFVWLAEISRWLVHFKIKTMLSQYSDDIAVTKWNH